MKSTADAPTPPLHEKVSVYGRYITPVLFTLAILLSAGLLFFVQPLLTRIVTPHAGGAPGVWTTAALFFQCTMIGGYLYAHLLTRLPRIRHQIGIHLMLWLAASTFLPMGIPEDWSADTTMSVQVQTLMLYAVTIGAPFFFLSANAPLIQTWYGRTRGPSSHDPYFLYGASNVGSLIALIGFPLIVEPFMNMESVTMGWGACFVALGALLFMSAFLTTRDHPDAKTVVRINDRSSDLKDLWTWGAIAFVPSSLMLAVTTRTTMDFGSFPLLWVIPLALYLLTYVAGFRDKALLSDNLMEALYPMAIGILALSGATSLLGSLTIPGAMAMILSFTIIGLHLHRRLYVLRPDTSRLTVFYLTLSIGGAAGGAFNAIVAPVLMDGMYEFQMTVLAACAVLLIGRSVPSRWSPALAIFLLVVLMMMLALETGSGPFRSAIFEVVIAASIVAACILMMFNASRPLAACILCLVTAVAVVDGKSPGTILQERNFFGIHKVADRKDMRIYTNGTTIHGGELLPLSESPEPIFYYRTSGPLAEIARSDAWTSSDRVGIVGLGVGAMLAYRQPEQEVDIYEIDPNVVGIAQNPDLFGFVSNYGQGASLHVGDARMILETQKSRKVGVLLLDAYSSDAIPMHLSTMEAMQSFMHHVKPGGILAYHISNRYFDLEVPLAAAAASLGLDAYLKYDAPAIGGSTAHATPVKALVVVRDGVNPGFLENGWAKLDMSPSEAWSDDRSSPLSALKW